MTPSEARKLKHHLQSAAKILKADTPQEQLQNFESIELAARQHMLETVGPAMGEIFFQQENRKPSGKSDKSKPALGQCGYKEQKPKS